MYFPAGIIPVVKNRNTGKWAALSPNDMELCIQRRDASAAGDIAMTAFVAESRITADVALADQAAWLFWHSRDDVLKLPDKLIASITSQIELGGFVALYVCSYQQLELPPGAALIDAEQFMPLDMFQSKLRLNSTDDDGVHDQSPGFDLPVLADCIRVRAMISSKHALNWFVDADTQWFRPLRADELHRLLHVFASYKINPSCRSNSNAHTVLRRKALHWCITPGDDLHIATPFACVRGSPFLIAFEQSLTQMLTLDTCKYTAPLEMLQSRVSSHGLDPAILDAHKFCPFNYWDQVRIVTAKNAPVYNVSDILNTSIAANFFSQTDRTVAGRKFRTDGVIEEGSAWHQVVEFTAKACRSAQQDRALVHDWPLLDHVDVNLPSVSRFSTSPICKSHDLMEVIYNKERFSSIGSIMICFRARFRATGSPRAIKIQFRKPKIETSPDYRRPDVDWLEVRHLCQCQGPFVVKLFDAWLGSESIVIVMEYCQCNLFHYRQHQQHGHLCPQQCRDIIANVQLGLKSIHDKMIAHRDLHSGNILIKADGNAVIADFDRSVGVLDDNFPQECVRMFCSPFCRPPEVIFFQGNPHTWTRDKKPIGLRGEPCIDVCKIDPLKADLWALGVLDLGNRFEEPFTAERDWYLGALMVSLFAYIHGDLLDGIGGGQHVLNMVTYVRTYVCWGVRAASGMCACVHVCRVMGATCSLTSLMTVVRIAVCVIVSHSTLRTS